MSLDLTNWRGSYSDVGEVWRSDAGGYYIRDHDGTRLSEDYPTVADAHAEALRRQRQAAIRVTPH